MKFDSNSFLLTTSGRPQGNPFQSWKAGFFWVNSRKLPAKMCIDPAFLCTKIQILCAQHAKWQPVWHSLGGNCHFDLTRPKTHRLVDSYHLPKLIFTTRKNSGFLRVMTPLARFPGKPLVNHSTLVSFELLLLILFVDGLIYHCIHHVCTRRM